MAFLIVHNIAFNQTKLRDFQITFKLKRHLPNVTIAQTYDLGHMFGLLAQLNFGDGFYLHFIQISGINIMAVNG